MNNERKILMEYGSGNSDELLDIAALGIAKLMFADMGSRGQLIKQKGGFLNETRVISSQDGDIARGRLSNIV